MKHLALMTMAAAMLQVAAAAGICGSQSCPKDAPCCVKGFCNANAMYCMDINCEPQNSYSQDSCWGTPHCVKSSVDFGRPGAFANIADYKGDPAAAAFVSQFEPSNARVGAGGELELELVKQADGRGFGATVINTRAIQYGTVTTVMRSGSAGPGVVSSFIIRNDKIGDEIDFEFVGADPSTVQSNYYWHNQLDYTKMVKSPPLSDTTKNFHTYQIVWTPDQITWSVDGAAFRTVRRADTWDPAANTFRFPDAEAYISYSVWDGGAGAQGTSEWAGGATQWGRAPFVVSVKSIDIDCHFGGNETTYTPPRGAAGGHSTASKSGGGGGKTRSSSHRDSDSDSDDGATDSETSTEDSDASEPESDDASSDGPLEDGAAAAAPAAALAATALLAALLL